MAEAKPKRSPPAAPTAPASTRKALMVVGMHRSGTSAAARMLSLAGGALPERLMNAGPDNPEGFWEPWEMVALNDRMLVEVGSRWDDVFIHRADAAVWDVRDDYIESATTFIAENYGDRDLPILKDPRASATSRFWREALAQQDLAPVYVILVRHPSEVARSIAARSGATIAASEMSWAATMAAVERDTRGWPRVFVGYDALLGDWRQELARIETALGRPLPARSAEAEGDIDRFLSGSHRHHNVPDEEASLAPLTRQTWSWMAEACRDQDPPGELMDGVIRQLDELAQAVSPALSDLRRELADYPGLRLRHTEAAAENAALRALCDRFHGEADRASRAADAAEKALATARALATETAPQRSLEAVGSGDASLIQAIAEIARCETRLIRERRLRAELAEADRATYERRKAEAVQAMADRWAEEQTAHSITQHGLAEAHRQLGLAAEAGRALTAAREATQKIADAATMQAAATAAEAVELRTLVAALNTENDRSIAERDAARAEAELTASRLVQVEQRVAGLEADLRLARDAERAATDRYAAAAQRLAQLATADPSVASRDQTSPPSPGEA
jgi:hypothetical protein